MQNMILDLTLLLEPSSVWEEQRTVLTWKMNWDWEILLVEMTWLEEESWNSLVAGEGGRERDSD